MSRKRKSKKERAHKKLIPILKPFLQFLTPSHLHAAFLIDGDTLCERISLVVGSIPFNFFLKIKFYMHKFEAARQSFLARHRLSGEIGVPSTFGDATEHSLRNDQLTTDSDCENDDGNNGSLVVDEEDDNDIHVVDVDLDDEIESFASDSLLPPLNVLPEAVKEDFLPRTLLGDNAQLPPFQPPLSRSFDCGAGAVRNNTRTKDDAPIRSSLPSFPLGAPPGNSTERNNSSEHYLINHAMRIMTSFATRLHFPENLTSLIIDELFPEKAQMTFLSQPELLHLYNEFFASLLILNPPSNIPSPHIAPATPRNPANPTNPKNLPVTNEHFAWPVFDMAALEFSASEGSGSPPSNSQSLITYHNNELKNNDSSLVLDNVVILVNLPQVSPADPHECESDPLISLVCTQMFMMIGTVKSAYFPLKKVEDGESLEVESTIIYKGVAFVEFEDSAATQRAETAFASALPFYVDLDNNSDSLQCRRFKTYSNSNENSFENDRSFNENHAEDAELDTSEEIAPFDVDAALKEALAPLEEHKKLTEERDEREREAAASYAVGAAAIAAMRGGLRRVGGENLAEEDESRNKRRQQQWASLINDVEIKLEEAIVSKCVNKIAKYDAKLVSLYGEVVETGSKGVFGNEGTLMMVQRLLYKDEGKSVVDDVASDSYNGSDSESDNESKPDLTVDERSLWRRCLQGERLRSAALMRKMLVSEKGHEKTKAENARLRHLLDDRSVRLNEARQSINQLEQIRDSLRRQQDATSGRLSAQREAIAR